MRKSLFIISLLVLLFIISINVVSFAGDPTVVVISDNIDDFDDLGEKIIGGIQAIGSIASVVVLGILGIKYMMGSVEERAAYKKTMLPYVIGAILVFAASNIADAVYEFANALN